MKKVVLFVSFAWVVLMVMAVAISGCAASGDFDGKGSGSIKVASPWGTDTRPK